MPDARLARARDTLPLGYQFGDARRPRMAIRFVQQWDRVPQLDGVLTRVQKRDLWRSMCETAAEQLTRQADPNSWNVLEGDH